FCLKDVEFNNFHPEVEFLFSWKKDYMKGFIDLVFEHQSKYYIIDWKSNYLSDFSKDYDTKNIEKEMSLHNYYLQAAIYTKSLKQHLKILNKDFEKVFGGVFYIFLRGQANSHESKTNNYGSYHFYPDLKVLDQMHNQKSRLDAR
nr:RecBCD enzyme subunit RecB [Candidatus Anoxychlamydiales bacterium]